MTLADLGAAAAAEAIAAGRITAADLTEACLARIAAREPAVHAFASLDAAATRSEAAARDAAPPLGPLHGVPFAVKDVLDTADLPTEMGSPIWAGHRPRADAAIVAMMRAAGGVLLGKTITAELAYVHPGPTTNPHDAAHTPGGSSSGSAAAVAAGMVPLALGTQTGGSILRPASFCGVVGFKPSFGLVPRGGLRLMADSLDTIGVLAREVADVALWLWLFGIAPQPPGRPPRLGLCRGPLWHEAEPAARRAVEEAAARLVAAGAEVTDHELPDAYAALTDARVVINDVEIARSLAHEWRTDRDRLSPRLAAAVVRGRGIRPDAYRAAQDAARRARSAFPDAMRGADALLVLAAASEAPAGLGHTGDSRFQGLWTLLHAPAIGLPAARGPRGLPIGIQLVAPEGQDAVLLAVAAWVSARLAPHAPG
jgi:amidase